MRFHCIYIYIYIIYIMYIMFRKNQTSCIHHTNCNVSKQPSIIGNLNPFNGCDDMQIVNNTTLLSM